MIEGKTVFVLGAGASCPYGYKTGIELRNEIIRSFPRRIGILRERETQWSRDLPSTQLAEAFVKDFDDASNNSIDLFLSRRSIMPEIVKTGKMAIVATILHHEKGSKFNSAIYDKRSEDSYNYIFTQMINHMRTPDDLSLEENDVSFITFNYDRSLEAFLHLALTKSYDPRYTGALESKLRAIEIVHVYGVVAGLPWQDKKVGYKINHPIEEIFPTHIHHCTEQIRVIDEDRDHPNVLRAQELLREASRVFFLGFGFAQENLDVLGIPDTLPKGKPIFGTVMGFEDGEKKKLEHTLGETSSDRAMIHLKPIDSKTLLRNYL